jgi:hypothetical protein
MTTSKKGYNVEKHLLIPSALFQTAQRLRLVACSSILVESLLDSESKTLAQRPTQKHSAGQSSQELSNCGGSSLGGLPEGSSDGGDLASMTICLYI